MEIRKAAKYWLGSTLVILAIGVLSSWMDGHVTFAEVWLTDASFFSSTFWSRFMLMFVFAVLIERSVETYLNVSGQNGTRQVVVGEGSSRTVQKRNAQQPAMVAALILGVLAAVCGLRLLETLVSQDQEAPLIQAAIWHGVDVIVSAGLLAGGSDLFHRVAQVLTGGLTRLRGYVGGVVPQVPESNYVSITQPGRTETMMAAIPEGDLKHEVFVHRAKGDDVETGVLRYSSGGVLIEAACRWSRFDRIEAGMYARCSRTHIPRLGGDTIYLPDAISRTSGERQIYLVSSNSPAGNSGCISINAAEFQALCEAVRYYRAGNIKVIVTDE